MAVDPITAGISLIETVVGKVWPDKSEQERAQMAAALSLVQGQIDINKAEAASPSAFTSSWRPAIGWVCAMALACQYIARPLLEWGGIVSGHPLPPLPGIDNNLWELLTAMLGLSGLRSYEKLKGVA
jgi:hypothetical protein